MGKITTNNLLMSGYKLENAKIKNYDISMADHGCLTFSMELEGYGWGVVYGRACLGNGYLGAKEFKSYPHTAEYLMRIMDTVGVERLSDLTGKFVRVVFENPTGASSVKYIGNLIDDKWFDAEEFMLNT